MIKSLRRKFITVSMCSVVLVLFLIISGINIANYRSVIASANEKLRILSENKGSFPQTMRPRDENSLSQDRFPLSPSESLSNEKMNDRSRNISVETPFDTRYFTVTLDNTGSVSSSDTGRIAAVSPETAVSYASALAEEGKTQGFLGIYKFTAIPVNDGTMYIFLDCSRDLTSFRNFLWASVLVSLLGLVLVFLLVLFFSHVVFRPIAESYEKQKRFITDASHEIKTPLTIIDANTEVIELLHGNDEWTASIRNQVKRLTALTEKLVFLSRMAESKSAVSMVDFSLSEAIRDCTQPYEAMAVTQHKELSLHVDEGIFYHGDESMLRQMICLLLDNAMKYSDEGGSITVTLKQTGKNIHLSFFNTLTDIPSGNLDVLFERFYRLDSSRNSKTGGSGIGLSVVQAIVTAHHGKIHARSTDGHSILFSITL